MQPLFTLVIPTYNHAQQVSLTLEGINAQIYDSYEVIVVDSGSTDDTVEVCRSTCHKALRLYTVAEYHLPEMYNRAISLAKGQYIAFLSPGDFYISCRTLGDVAQLIAEHDTPELVYGGSLVRELAQEPEIMFNPLSLDRLRKGIVPTSLQASWFKGEILKTLGKFDPAYQVRGGFDLFCRFCRHPNLHFSAMSCVVIDYDRRLRTTWLAWRSLAETLAIIRRHFGWRAALRWWLQQKHLGYIRSWWHRTLSHLLAP